MSAKKASSNHWSLWLLFVVVGGFTVATCLPAPPLSLVGLVGMYFLWKGAQRVERLEDEVDDLRSRVGANDPEGRRADDP